MSANFAPEDFLRSNDKKVRRSNTIFYRELQNCEKSLIKSKIIKNNAQDFPCRKVVVLSFTKIIVYFLKAFFNPQKSTGSSASIDIMQNIPRTRDFSKAQEAIPHKIKGIYHT